MTPAAVPEGIQRFLFLIAGVEVQKPLELQLRVQTDLVPAVGNDKLRQPAGGEKCRCFAQFLLDAVQQSVNAAGCTVENTAFHALYVTSEEMTRLEPSVKEYEPALALDGGKDGLDFYRAVAANYSHLLVPGGSLCFEFGLGQHMAVSMILQEYGYTDIVLRKDLRGVVRAARGKKK